MSGEARIEHNESGHPREPTFEGTLKAPLRATTRHRPLFDNFVERGRECRESDSAALTTHDEAIDEKQHDGTDHAREEAR
jgi:hypothetical protein